MFDHERDWTAVLNKQKFQEVIRFDMDFFFIVLRERWRGDMLGHLPVRTEDRPVRRDAGGASHQCRTAE